MPSLLLRGICFTPRNKNFKSAPSSAFFSKMSETNKMILKFSFSDSFSGLTAPPTDDVIVIADSKSLLLSHLENGNAAFNQLLKEADIELLKNIASSRITPGAESPSSVETFSVTSGTPLKLTLSVLPTACSRHNTPARSHAVSSVVKAYKGSKNLVVVLLPSTRDHIFAQAIAVSRNFSEFSLKSSSKSDGDVKKKQRSVTVVIEPPADFIAEDAEKLIEEISNTADGIRLAQRLVDAPPNVLHTDSYVEECRVVATRIGCPITVIGGADLDAMGCGGIWGVGKASERLPALVILSHVPSGSEDKQSVCLVGKGIVYDTGGLSIKTPGNSMAGMKDDMGGSASVLGAFEAAVRSGHPGPFHALLCIAENSVGPLSTRPDDVHTMLSGKTVEVNNTDAEGRLVLSDGVFYAAKNLNPKVIIDIATLTGAQLIATGKNHAAIYCSDDDLEDITVAAGKATGDLVHPLPYCPEFYKKEFNSQVADMKNSVADRQNAQASCAAQFIGNHIEEYISQGGKWLHVDMAGPVSTGERATGYGVALLFALLQKLNA